MPIIPLPPTVIFPPAAPLIPTGHGGLQFKDAAPLICGVVDNGVAPDDPRVLTRLNEATQIILHLMTPVGGMARANIAAIDGTHTLLNFGSSEPIILLPPTLENIIEIHPVDARTKVRGDADVTGGWYEITNNSVYLDPGQQHDNPTIDLGMFPDPQEPSVLRRAYSYPGLQPPDAIVQVTAKKRYLPITNDEDYLIVQNIEAIKLVILSIERNENAAPDEAPKYRQQAFEMLQAEVKNHIVDPMNYMFRRAAYHADLSTFPPNTLGWMRAQIALDIDDAMRTGKADLTWSINQIERRIMQKAIFKDCITDIEAEVQGGIVYFPLYVGSVLAVDLEGRPIPIRSQFFEHMENGPGMFGCHEMLKDLGDEYFASTQTTRRKYRLLANCDTTQTLNAVCKLRWIEKQPNDLMVIKNYEAIRLFMTAKFLEEKEDWKNALANQQQAWAVLDNELKDYLAGILHTVHVQTFGFGLNDIGGYWGQ